MSIACPDTILRSRVIGASPVMYARSMEHRLCRTHLCQPAASVMSRECPRLRQRGVWTISTSGRSVLYDDTIAAIATPVGEGGIGIIRLSGRDALPIVQRLFSPHRATARYIPQRML